MSLCPMYVCVYSMSCIWLFLPCRYILSPSVTLWCVLGREASFPVLRQALSGDMNNCVILPHFEVDDPREGRLLYSYENGVMCEGDLPLS